MIGSAKWGLGGGTQSSRPWKRDAENSVGDKEYFGNRGAQAWKRDSTGDAEYFGDRGSQAWRREDGSGGKD